MWQYQNKELEQEQIPEKAIGFIYFMKNLKTGRKYLGRKLLTKAAYKTVKGIKKSIRKESDWKDYYSSSPELLKDVEEIGKENFQRTILFFCESKALLNYFEEKLQMIYGVLEDEKWYNSNIRSKHFKRNILNKTSIEQFFGCHFLDDED